MMRALVSLLAPILVAGCTMLPSALAHDPLDALQRRVISVSKRVTPSVVHIEAAVRVNTRRNLVTGSGLVMDAKGIVLTNEHVVDRAEKVSVVVPGRPGRYRAEVVGTDKLTDLAVLKIELRPGDEPLPVADLGDSDAVLVGEWVIAIGNPYGLEGTVSLGIVSAKGRDLRAENLLNDFIQTDAMIDRGSSGGPLVNLKAEVIGINSRGQGRGIGFTIPINTAKRVAAELLGDGEIARGYLGLSIQPFSRELAEYWHMQGAEGVIVNGVTRDSPASDAGIEVGDIVTRYGDTSVRAEKDEDIGTFQRLVARSEIGTEVSIGLLRNGEAVMLAVRVGAQPKIVPDEQETDFGFTVQEVTDALYRSNRLTQREGVLVSFVERGSEAAEAGMAVGDLIVKVEKAEVGDIDAFRGSLDDIEPGSPFLVRARRGSDLRFLLIVPRGSASQASRPSPRPTGG